MLLDSKAADVVYTPAISGVPANFLRGSLAQAGYDADALPAYGQGPSFASDEAKVWRDVWSAGQGVGSITEVASTSLVVARLRSDYYAARSAGIRLGHPSASTREPVRPAAVGARA